MTVDKSSTTAGLSAPASVSYSYLVANTGNVTLTGIALADDTVDAGVSCPSATLAVSASESCTATHSFSQAELDANGSPAGSGNLNNGSTACREQGDVYTDTLCIEDTQTATMTVDKSSTTAGLSAPASVSYSYLVANTGNVTLTGIALADDNVDAGVSCPSATLAVSASESCTATHSFSQAELDANGSPAGSGNL